MNRRVELTLFKRWARQEEIADAVLFLSSDAARYITGQVLSVNGGTIMVY
jgi:NAD(P)-dependent dehydrogenase (short-subunit alcohol dehydrogenase family)